MLAHSHASALMQCAPVPPKLCYHAVGTVDDMLDLMRRHWFADALPPGYTASTLRWQCLPSDNSDPCVLPGPVPGALCDFRVLLLDPVHALVRWWQAVAQPLRDHSGTSRRLRVPLFGRNAQMQSTCLPTGLQAVRLGHLGDVLSLVRRRPTVAQPRRADHACKRRSLVRAHCGAAGCTRS